MDPLSQAGNVVSPRGYLLHLIFTSILQSVAPDLPSSSSPSIGVSRPFRNRIFWREVFRAPRGAIQSTERHRTPAAALLLSWAQNCAQFSVLRWAQRVNCPDQSEPDVHLVRYNWTGVHLYPNIAVLWQQSEPIMCTDSTNGWGGGEGGTIKRGPGDTLKDTGHGHLDFTRWDFMLFGLKIVHFLWRKTWWQIKRGPGDKDTGHWTVDTQIFYW